jgi:hypothetical protein
MPFATASGTFEYNGVSLNDGALRLEIAQKPIMDEAQRTVVCIETTITAHTVIQADAGTDDSLESIRSALTKQGQALTFANKGFGDDLNVNDGFAPNSLRDVKWGPVPEVLAWNPIGDDKAAEVTWRVTTWLPPICTTNGVVNSKGVMAFNFSMDFAINGKGFTTRTISGYIEIAMTRNGGARNMSDCADLYREQIAFPPPNDFKRESQKWTLSADKRRLDFVLVDKQIESRKAYPPGVLDIRMDHRASWSRANGQAMILRNTITADIEIAAHLPRMMALKIFLDIAFRKINKHRNAGVGVLIDSFDMTEEMFGLGSSFGISFRVLKTLKDILGLGFWEDLGTTDLQWRVSVEAAFGPRGFAGLGLQPDADIIVDLCRPQLPYFQAATTRPNEPQYAQSQYKNQQPPKDSSWLDFQNQLQPGRTVPTARQPTMQTPQQSDEVEDIINNAVFGYSGPAGTSDTIQQAGRPMYEVTMYGAARRVGYEIPRPGLIAVGGQTPVEVASVFDMRDEGDHFGVRVYSAAWAVTYMLPNSPGDTIHPRPQLRDGGGSNAAIT